MSSSRKSGQTAVEIESPSSSNLSSPTDERKIEQLKAHVAEVSNIMQENIGKILERGTRLDQIENRTDALSNRADDFRVNARLIRKKMWWQNARMNLILLAGFILLGVLIGYLVWSKTQSS